MSRRRFQRVVLLCAALVAPGCHGWPTERLLTETLWTAALPVEKVRPVTLVAAVRTGDGSIHLEALYGDWKRHHVVVRPVAQWPRVDGREIAVVSSEAFPAGAPPLRVENGVDRPTSEPTVFLHGGTFTIRDTDAGSLGGWFRIDVVAPTIPFAPEREPSVVALAVLGTPFTLAIDAVPTTLVLAIIVSAPVWSPFAALYCLVTDTDPKLIFGE